MKPMRMEVNGSCKPGPVQVPISPSGIFGLVFYCSIDEVGPWGTIPIPSFDAFVGTISEVNLRFLRAGVGRTRWGWEFWNEINLRWRYVALFHGVGLSSMRRVNAPAPFFYRDMKFTLTILAFQDRRCSMVAWVRSALPFGGLREPSPPSSPSSRSVGV